MKPLVDSWFGQRPHENIFTSVGGSGGTKQRRSRAKDCRSENQLQQAFFVSKEIVFSMHTLFSFLKGFFFACWSTSVVQKCSLAVVPPAGQRENKRLLRQRGHHLIWVLLLT